MFPLIPIIGKLIFGEVVSQVVEGAKGKITEVVGKGLIRSKTAKVASGALVAKLMATWALPLGDTLKWVLSAVVLIEYGVNLYMRAITKDSVIQPRRAK